jgi:hypothetical protein
MDAPAQREQWIALGLAGMGVVAWLYWTITDPTFDVSAAQDEWPDVLAFSGFILMLGIGAATLARTACSSVAVRRLANALVVAAVVGAVTNIVEDGFGVEQAFIVFAMSTGAQLLCLLGLAVALAVTIRGPRRILAFAPLGSALGIIAYVVAGGPIMLATWCGAAVVLMVTRRSGTRVRSASTIG